MSIAGSVFVDTSGWAEPLMGNSPDHTKMEQYYKGLIANKTPLATINYVLSELVALLAARSRFTRPQLLTITQRIRHMTQLTVLHIDLMLPRMRKPGRFWSNTLIRSGLW